MSVRELVKTAGRRSAEWAPVMRDDMVHLRTPTLSYTRVASFRRRLVGGVVCKVHKSEGQGKVGEWTC